MQVSSSNIIIRKPNNCVLSFNQYTVATKRVSQSKYTILVVTSGVTMKLIFDVLHRLRDQSLYTEMNTKICLTPLAKCMFVLQSRREYKISKLYYQFYYGDEEEIYLDALHHLRDLNLFTRTNLLYLSSSIFAVCFAQHCFRMFIIDIQKQLYLSCK